MLNCFRIRGLRTASLILFNLFNLTWSDSPNHSHANPKIVYVSPFSSEPRAHHSASDRQANSVVPLAGTVGLGSSDYATNQLPLLKNHDYSNAVVVQDPAYATAPELVDVQAVGPAHVDEPLHIHVDVPEPQPAYTQSTQEIYSQPAVETYGQPAPDTYGEPALDTYSYSTSTTEAPPAPPAEPQSAPAPSLGLLQLLPLFVITVLAVIASTIVGAIIG